MRKYILLCMSICMILLPLFFMYEANKPRGPVGDGTISPIYWIPFISTLIAGLINFAYSLLLFKRERS